MMQPEISSIIIIQGFRHNLFRSNWLCFAPDLSLKLQNKAMLCNKASTYDCIGQRDKAPNQISLIEEKRVTLEGEIDPSPNYFQLWQRKVLLRPSYHIVGQSHSLPVVVPHAMSFSQPLNLCFHHSRESATTLTLSKSIVYRTHHRRLHLLILLPITTYSLACIPSKYKSNIDLSFWLVRYKD
jgi:hypothetical protein